MMDDLIRRSDVINAIRSERNYLLAREQLNAEHVLAHHFDAIMEDIPAVDAVEVRHGHWMTTDAFPHRVYCSECYKTYIPNDRWQIWQDVYGDGGLPRDYCPNCGAKMDGEDGDGDG